MILILRTGKKWESTGANVVRKIGSLLVSIVLHGKIRVAVAHNKHNNLSQGQYSETAVVAFGNVTGTIDETAVDLTGLGRWALLKLQGRESRKTRIISAYNLCKPRGCKFKPNTVYNQHKQHFLKNGITEYPQKIFERYLIAEIKICKKINEQLILCIAIGCASGKGILTLFWRRWFRFNSQ